MHFLTSFFPLSSAAVDVIATERVWGGPVVGVSQRRGLQSLRDAQSHLTASRYSVFISGKDSVKFYFQFNFFFVL